MANPRHVLGVAAEDAVVAWLSASGWRVIGRRQRSDGGAEVDVVAVDPGGVLVGIEVRARRSRRTGVAEETVTARHARRIGRTVAHVARVSGLGARGLRVDVVTVEPVATAPDRWRMRRLPGVDCRDQPPNSRTRARMDAM
jgi:Holliday junction resolvase-like predicted endonuclease